MVVEHSVASGKQGIVAGSIGPTSELFEPLGQLTHANELAAFAEQAEALAKGNVDMLRIEKMSSAEEEVVKIEAAKMTK